MDILNVFVSSSEILEAYTHVYTYFFLIHCSCGVWHVHFFCFRLPYPCWSRTTKRERWLCPLLWLWLSKSSTKQWMSASCRQRKVRRKRTFLLLFPFTISRPKLGPALLPIVYDNKTLFRTDCFSGDCHPDTGRWEDENKSAETERSGGTHQAPRGRRGEGWERQKGEGAEGKGQMSKIITFFSPVSPKPVLFCLLH